MLMAERSSDLTSFWYNRSSMPPKTRKSPFLRDNSNKYDFTKLILTHYKPFLTKAMAMTGIAYPHMAPPTAASQQLSNDQERMSTVREIIGDMLSRNINVVTEYKERYLHVIWILQVDLYTNGNKPQK